MIKKFTIFAVLFISIICNFILPQNVYASTNNYKWILNPSYEYEDITNIDLFEDRYEYEDITNIDLFEDRYEYEDINIANSLYPIKYGYTANNLYGIAVVKKDEKYNVIDYDGNLLFEKFIEEKPYFRSVSADGTFTYMNTTYAYPEYDSFGNFVSTEREAGYSSDTLTWNKSIEKFGYLEMGDGYGEIDSNELPKGCFVVQEAENIYNNETNMSYPTVNNKFGIVKDGKLLVYPKYEEMKQFHEDMAAYKLGQKWGFVNSLGEEVVKPQYDYVGSFVHGYAPVKLDTKSAYIDKNGKNITGFIFEETRPLDVYNGYSWVKENGKWGVIQINGIKKSDIVLKADDWKTVYIRYLRNLAWTNNDLNPSSYEGITFGLLDIDQNGIPELIIQDDRKDVFGDNFADSFWSLYILSYDGKKVHVQKLDDYFEGYDEKNKLFITRGNKRIVYGFENGKCIEKFNYQMFPQNDYYRINEKGVEYEEFNSFMKPYYFKKTVILHDLDDNTILEMFF